MNFMGLYGFVVSAIMVILEKWNNIYCLEHHFSPYTVITVTRFITFVLL